MGIPTQATYAENMDALTVGMVPSGEAVNAFSRTVETVGGIGFGLPVAQGAADRGCILLAAGGKFLGITRRNPAVSPADGDKFAQYKEAAIVDFGPIAVKVNVAVAARDLVYFNAASGKFTNNNADLACAGCVFDTSAAAQGIAVVRIRKS